MKRNGNGESGNRRHASRVEFVSGTIHSSRFTLINPGLGFECLNRQWLELDRFVIQPVAFLVPQRVFHPVRVVAIGSRRNRCGRRGCAPRDSLRAAAETMVDTAVSIRLSSSSASMRAVLKTLDLSLMHRCWPRVRRYRGDFLDALGQPVLETEHAAVRLHRACACRCPPCATHSPDPSRRRAAPAAPATPRRHRPAAACAVTFLVGALDHLVPGRLAEHQQIEQRVGAQAVGAVHRYAGAFAHRDTGRCTGLSPPSFGHDHLALVVGRNAAHLVVAWWAPPESAP